MQKKYKGKLFSRKGNGNKKYVDNEKFYHVLVEFLNRRKENPEEKIPEFIGECLYKIAEKISNMPIFSGYPFKDDLIGEAVYTSLKYIHCFNPEKSKNPFSYFTRVIYFSFLQIIKKEKRYISLKNRAIMNFDIDNFLDSGYNSDVENYLRGKINDYYRIHDCYI